MPNVVGSASLAPAVIVSWISPVTSLGGTKPISVHSCNGEPPVSVGVNDGICNVTVEPDTVVLSLKWSISWLRPYTSI